MKIVRPKPKCKGCGHWRIMVHCQSVMMNGCDTYWCFVCWSDHSAIHTKEWDEMTESDKTTIIERGI